MNLRHFAWWPLSLLFLGLRWAGCRPTVALVTDLNTSFGELTGWCSMPLLSLDLMRQQHLSNESLGSQNFSEVHSFLSSCAAANPGHVAVQVSRTLPPPHCGGCGLPNRCGNNHKPPLLLIVPCCVFWDFHSPNNMRRLTSSTPRRVSHRTFIPCMEEISARDL